MEYKTMQRVRRRSKAARPAFGTVSCKWLWNEDMAQARQITQDLRWLTTIMAPTPASDVVFEAGKA